MREALVKLQRKGQMVIPRSLREQAGVAEGTLMKVSIIRGSQFLLTPQITVDRPAVGRRSKNGKEIFRELAEVVAELRREAKEKGIDKMTKRQINAAVAAARRDLKKTTTKRPVK